MNRPPVSELWLSSDPESSFLTWPQTIRAGSRYLLRELRTISSAKETSPEHVSKTSGTKFGHSESPHRPGMWSLLSPRGAGPWGKRLRANSLLANCEAMLNSSSRYGNSEWYPVDNKGWESKSDPEETNVASSRSYSHFPSGSARTSVSVNLRWVDSACADDKPAPLLLPLFPWTTSCGPKAPSVHWLSLEKPPNVRSNTFFHRPRAPKQPKALGTENLPS